MEIAVVTKGDKEIMRKLEALTGTQAKAVLRKGLREGAKVFLQQIRSNVVSMFSGAKISKRTGKHNTRIGMFRKIMRKALTVRAGKKRRRGFISFRVIFNTDKYPELFDDTSEGKRYFIPTLLEYGHGGAKPIPFMRSAFDAKKNQALRVTMTKMRDEMENLAKRK